MSLPKKNIYISLAWCRDVDTGEKQHHKNQESLDTPEPALSLSQTPPAAQGVVELVSTAGAGELPGEALELRETPPHSQGDSAQTHLTFVQLSRGDGQLRKEEEKRRKKNRGSWRFVFHFAAFLALGGAPRLLQKA